MVSLSSSIETLPRLNTRFVARLRKLGIKTIKDLLWHFPTRYQDFSVISKIEDLKPFEEITIQGTVKSITNRRAWHRRMILTEALVNDETGSVQITWFNQPYIRNILTPGKLASFSGKATILKNKLILSNPAYELVKSVEETTHTGRIIGIYPETRGLTSKGIRNFIKTGLDTIPKLQEFLPRPILYKNNLSEINKALRDIHFPENLENATRAKKRFAFEDLFFLQLYNLRERLKLAKENALAIRVDIEEIKKIIAGLPFELTLSQKKSLWEITQDLEKNHPMNRLLQGDVGSGKTIVAAIAAIMATINGYQIAFMAPTEILAHQHYRTFPKFFKDFEQGIALLTSSTSKIYYGEGLETNCKKEKLLKDFSENKIKIIIGTHALIQKDVAFEKLALVIIDEQHRFGVRQRAGLVKRQAVTKPASSDVIRYTSHETDFANEKRETIPHLLSMSATPIPRTLSLTLWSDLDLSLITELPKNRKPIITKVVNPMNREKAYQFIREQIQKGRQVFVICPRIEEENKDVGHPNIETTFRMSDIQKLETKSVKVEYEKLSQKIFPDLEVTMLHGKMKSKEKESIMTGFKDGKTDILVSTSVIEVGVDVPNATIMMIEGAERFGLAQLYQFRGRVGRGEHQSFCFLFTESTAKSVHARLKSIVEAKNGLELAEKDLKLRGPGEFLGEIQTGMPDIAMKALKNPELVKHARDAAAGILREDPLLEKYPSLNERLVQFQQEVHWE